MSETIKEIHAAIFGGPNDYEGQGINPNDVTMLQLNCKIYLNIKVKELHLRMEEFTWIETVA